MGREKSQIASQVQSRPYLMVATDLSVISGFSDPGQPLVTDKVINKRAFRLLDAFYYSWLRLRVDLAAQRLDAGRLRKQLFDKMCSAFDRIHRWAMQHLNREELARTFATFKPESYIAPRVNFHGEAISSFIYASGGVAKRWKHIHPVTAIALQKVHSISEKAIAAGWTEERLYANGSDDLKFPYGNTWGFVCHLFTNYQPGDVTQEFIELIGPKPFENVLRFYSPDVVQPWQRPCEADVKSVSKAPIPPLDTTKGAKRLSDSKRKKSSQSKIKNQLVLFTA